MYEQTESVGPRYSASTSGSLLPDSLRREVADLNGQFLRLLQAGAWPSGPRWPVRPSWVADGLDADSIDAMAACPFTLFELRLDDLPPQTLNPEAHVRDAQRSAANSTELRCQALAHGALMLAWRLAEASPLSLRLALGLPAAAELLMNETRVSSLVTWARTSDLLGARWADHPVFWPNLLRAGHLRDAASMSRTHCLGITLLVGELGLREFDGGCGRHGTLRNRR
jgi:hypothetical protein